MSQKVPHVGADALVRAYVISVARFVPFPKTASSPHSVTQVTAWADRFGLP